MIKETEATPDATKSSPLLEACRFIAERTGECPESLIEWSHPETCWKHCSADCASECWKTCFEQMASKRFDQLMNFYDAETMEDLIDEQEKHIVRLQAQIRSMDKPHLPSKYRNG